MARVVLRNRLFLISSPEGILGQNRCCHPPIGFLLLLLLLLPRSMTPAEAEAVVESGFVQLHYGKIEQHRM